MNKKILIFGGGKLSRVFLKDIGKNDFIIGVDRGAYWLIQNNIIPDLALGDFDSVTKKELSIIQKKSTEVRSFPKEKNWTDMELAIKEAIQMSPREVIIYGGIGSRLDHTFGTFHLLDILLEAGVAHALKNERNLISLIGIGRTILVKGGEKYVSILPHSQKISVSLEGFLYNLSKTDVYQGSTMGISNEIIGQSAVIKIFSGKAWVIRSRD